MTRLDNGGLQNSLSGYTVGTREFKPMGFLQIRALGVAGTEPGYPGLAPRLMALAPGIQFDQQ